MIEDNAGAVELAAEVERHVLALKTRVGRFPDRAILGCTHYEIVADMFRAALPPGTPLIHQPGATAEALIKYLDRHPELDPGHSGLRRFLTTGVPAEQNGLVKAFWGGSLTFEAA
jgi:glutamate racemase